MTDPNSIELLMLAVAAVNGAINAARLRLDLRRERRVQARRNRRGAGGGTAER